MEIRYVGGGVAAVAAGWCRTPEREFRYTPFPQLSGIGQPQSEKRCCPPSLRSAGQSLPDFVEQCRFSNLAGWALKMEYHQRARPDHSQQSLQEKFHPPAFPLAKDLVFPIPL